MPRAWSLILLAGCAVPASIGESDAADTDATPDTEDTAPDPTLLICADGAADFVTLAEAVAAAPDGATSTCARESTSVAR